MHVNFPKPFEGVCIDPLIQEAPLPYSSMLKIIFCQVACEEDAYEGCFPDRLRVGKAIECFNELGKEGELFSRFVREEHTCAVFIKALVDQFGSLGRLSHSGTLDNGLNLNPVLLKKGFELYLKDPNNKFSELADLDKKVRETAIELLESANKVFQGKGSLLPINRKALSLGDATFNIKIGDGCFDVTPTDGLGYFEILVSLKELRIFTPLCSIQIVETFSVKKSITPEQTPRLPLLALAEVLINRLGAVLEGFNSDYDQSRYELLNPDSSNHKIREVGGRHLAKLSHEDSLNVRGTQRVIIPEKGNGWSLYRLKTIGIWEGYVLEIARYLYEGKGLPRSVFRLFLNEIS